MGLNTISKYLRKWKENIMPKKMLENTSNYTNNDNEKIKTKSENFEDLNYSFIQLMLNESDALNKEILGDMNEEWSDILCGANDKVKVKKLYAALVKEQMRRETAQKIAKESKDYAFAIKEQTTKRMSDLRHSLVNQVDFLNKQIKELKEDTRESLNYYREQLDKSNTHLSLLKK